MVAAVSTYVQSNMPAFDAMTITPANTGVLSPVPRALYVTVAGTLQVITANGTTISFGTVTAGQLIPVAVQQVTSTGTTATVIGLV